MGFTFSYAGIFGPSNFDDCVLESMKGVTSDVAARAIYKSCLEKFPKKQVKRSTRALTPWELYGITGRGGPSYTQDHFSVDLLNGNKGITVSEITLAITTKIEGKEVTNFYDNEVDIGPNKMGNIFVKFIPGDAGAKFSWAISAAKGY